MKLTLRLFVLGAISLVCVWGQKSGGTGTSSGGTSTGTTGGTTGGATGGTTGGTGPGTPTTPGNPTSPIQPTNPTPTPPVASPPRPIFLSGSVAVDDGSPLPGPVNIQSICSSQQRTVAHTSSNGDFAFQWADRNSAIFSDASDNVHSTSFGPPSTANTGGRVVDPLTDCDLRAEYPGYTSSRISLFNHSSLDSAFDVGIILLHRVTGDEGTIVSMLSLKAPKDAKKNFDKGMDQIKAKKPTDAIASFQKAVATYPQYADAWLSMGRAEYAMGQKDEARADFQKAMDLDVKLVGPWQELGYMASDQSKWEEAAKYLAQALRLDPMNSPMTWYFSAMANYNLGKYDIAEKNIRSEMKLDHGANPRAQFLLGLTLLAKKDVAGGTDALKAYIAASPNGQDVELAKKQLSRLESQPAK